MARHAAGVVAPFSMLVPVTGILAGWVLLDQAPTLLELAGGVLVVGGVLWATVRRRPRGAVPVQEAEPAHAL